MRTVPGLARGEEGTAGTLGDIVRAHRLRVAATYFLTLVENLFWVAYPWATGVAIDGLLAGSWQGIAPLVAMWSAHIAVAATRRAYDTRLFTRIYGSVATRIVTRQRAAGAGTTEVAARAAMARELVDFVEREVPAAVAVVVGLAGAVGMLFAYDLLVGLAAAGLLLPVYALNRVYGRRARRLNRRLNDQVEREVAVVAEGGREAVAAHFAAVARWRVRLSDAEVVNQALVEAAALATVVLVLLRTARLPGVQAGEIYAILAYLWTMLEQLDRVPIIVQQLARLADIRRRLEDDDPAPGERADAAMVD